MKPDEKSCESGSHVARFRQVGMSLRVEPSWHHRHHRFALLDGSLLLSGSYNSARGAAWDNEENLHVTDDQRLIAAYTRAFERLWGRFGA